MFRSTRARIPFSSERNTSESQLVLLSISILVLLACMALSQPMSAQDGTLTPGTAAPVSITTPGQNAIFTFSGTAGQQVNVWLLNSTFPGVCYSLTLSVLNPDGSTLKSVSVCGQGNFGFSLLTLPTTGTYSVVIVPGDAGTGSASVMLSTELMAGTLTPGTAAPVSITTPGQNAIFTFSGTAGQQASLTLDNSTFPGSCYSLNISILNPNSSTLTSVNECGQGNFSVGNLTLPSTGTYSLVIAPQNAGTGSMTVNLWESNIPTATPLFSVPSGTYGVTQTVMLSDATSDATIYYTTDGTEPTSSSTQYTGPITVAVSETIKAIATAPNYLTSAVATATYTLSGAPSLATLYPADGVVGVPVTISGSLFGATQGTSTVTLNGVALVPSYWSQTMIIAKLPQNAASGNIIVSVGGATSNGVYFTVVDPTTGYHRTITIDHTKVPNTNQANFPVLIAGTYPYLATIGNSGRVLNSNGNDVLFTSDPEGKNLLDFEVDTYNPVNGSVAYWVRVPSLSHTTDTVIYLWYAIPGLDASQANPTGAWDSNFTAVYHMQTGSSGIIATDSTVNQNNPLSQNNGIALPTAQVGNFGTTVATFNGSQGISLPSFAISTFTVSAWIYPTQSGDTGAILAGPTGAMESRITNGNTLTLAAEGVSEVGSSSGNLALNTWSHVTVSYDGSLASFYINGAPSGSASNSLIFTNGNYFIGRADNGDNFVGSIDELRLSNSVRSSDWIATEYNNASSPSAFYSVGQEYNSTGPLPTIFTISPNPALSGQWVNITGVGFGSTQGSGAVTINGLSVSASSWNDTNISFMLPVGSGSGPLGINNGSTDSFPLQFTNSGSGTPSGNTTVGQNCPSLTQNQFSAWASPTSVSYPNAAQPNATNGDATGTLNSGGVVMTNSGPLNNWWFGVVWGGFQMPSIPPAATVQGVYAAANFSGGGSGAWEVLTFLDPLHQQFFYDTDDSITGACSFNLLQEGVSAATTVSGTQFGGYLFATLLQPSISKTFDISNPGMEIIYSLPSTPSTSLYLLDPFLLQINSDNTINQSDVISAAYDSSNALALGLIADGASTAIVVYKTNVYADVQISVPTAFASDGTPIPLAYISQWNSSFLTSPPQAAGTSIGIHASDLIADPSGNYFYAVVLVQAPLGTLNMIQSFINTLTAWQPAVGNSTMINKTITMVPRPVVLIHGLWGGIDSLDSTTEYLQSLGTYSTYNMPDPICYSTVLPFDADPNGSTVPTTNGCPYTASNAIDIRLAQIYHIFDENGIVGGRIDVVAHSMGGLGVRHYSSLSQYKSTRNRNLGEFATVVTIDTPEDGSALAPFLLQPAVAGGTCSSNALCATATAMTDSAAAYTNACGTDTLLATCLANFGDPLGPSGSGPGGFNTLSCDSAGSWNCGAVASLDPASPNIGQLPDPKIPHTKWFAIGADWKDDNSSSEPSELRVLLNYLLDAMSISSPPPTLSGVLGSIDNDVIVTTSSQFWNSSGIQFAEFPYLAHSALPALAKVKIPQLIGSANDSIIDSDGVNSCVAGMLLSFSTTRCTGAETGTGTVSEASTLQLSKRSETSDNSIIQSTGYLKESREERLARIQHPISFKPERLSVEAKQQDVSLGKPTEVAIQVAPGQIVNLIGLQRNEFGSIAHSGGSLKIVQDEGVVKLVEIVPRQLGFIDLEITALYSDNVSATQSIRLHVVPSPAGLKQFSLNSSVPNSVLEMVMEDAARDRQYQLRPQLRYKDTKYPIFTNSFEDIKLSVQQLGYDGTPAIMVDKDGVVHALHEGIAYIIGNFAGIEDRVKVTVYSKNDAPPGYRTIEP